MNKKIIIILSVIIFLLTAGAIFIFFTKKGEEIKDEGFFGLFPVSEEQDIGKDGLLPGQDNLPPGVFQQGQLIQLTKSAISGAGLSSTTIRYVEKSTGHIFEINPDGSEKNRISNTTILKSFESLFSYSGERLVIRYLEDSGDYFNVSNFSGTFSTTSLEGIFLPSGIKTIAVSPEEEKIFYLISSGGSYQGILADFENKKQQEILSFSFGEFNLNWPAKNIIALLTKPSNNIEGYLYFLDAKTKSFNKILGNIKGLTAVVSPDAGKIIYSQSAGGKITTKIFDVKSKETNNFNFNTMPEKCVWSRNDKNIVYCAVPILISPASYPDDWYQGLISFNDSVWQVDLSTGEANVIFEQSDIDIVSPFLTTDENYLIFTNKKDNTLWSLKLK